MPRVAAFGSVLDDATRAVDNLEQNGLWDNTTSAVQHARGQAIRQAFYTLAPLLCTPHEFVPRPLRVDLVRRALLLDIIFSVGSVNVCSDADLKQIIAVRTFIERSSECMVAIPSQVHNFSIILSILQALKRSLKAFAYVRRTSGSPCIHHLSNYNAH